MFWTMVSGMFCFKFRQRRIYTAVKKGVVVLLAVAAALALIMVNPVRAGVIGSWPILSLKNNTHILPRTDPFFNTSMSGNFTIGQRFQGQWLWVEFHEVVTPPGGMIGSWPIRLQHEINEDYNLSFCFTVEMVSAGVPVGNAYAFPEGQTPPQVEPPGGVIGTFPLADPRPTAIVIYAYASGPTEVGWGTFSLGAWLIYDRGEKDDVIYLADFEDRLAVQFTPPPYAPYTISQLVAINVTIAARTPEPYRFGIDISNYLGECLISCPPRTIASLPTQNATRGVWKMIDTSEYDIFVSDDFYVEWRPMDEYEGYPYPALYADSEPEQPWLMSNRSYRLEGGIWTQDTEHDYLIRAALAPIASLTPDHTIASATGEFSGSFEYPKAVDNVEVVATHNIAEYEIQLGSIELDGQLQVPWENGWLVLRIYPVHDVPRDFSVWINPAEGAWTWPMSRHDPSNQAFSPSTAPNTNRTEWTRNIRAPVESSPAVDYDKVYVSSTHGKVYALNAWTGNPEWNYTLGEETISSPAVAKGMLFVGGGTDKKVHALNASTGQHIWNYTTGCSVVSSPTIAHGNVYIGSNDGRVYALNAKTGALVWAYMTSTGIGTSSPAVANGKVFIGNADGKVYALNASTGQHIWNYTTGGAVENTPAFEDGRVYFGSMDGNVYCLNGLSGQKIWNYTTYWVSFSSAAVAYNVVYIGSYDYNLYALTAERGNLLWNYTTDDVVISSPAVADGKVYVGTAGDIDDKIYSINAYTGELIWNYKTGGETGRSNPVVAYGNVYIGTSKRVCCFGPRHGLTIPGINISKTVVGQGYSMGINITVRNLGDMTERFNLEVYYNGVIGTYPVTLPPLTSTTVTIYWATTGVAKGNYTISAYASPVPGETDTGDNTLTDGTITVVHPGDLDNSGEVDIADVVMLTAIYRVKIGDPNYNACRDIIEDGVIDIADVVAVTSHYRERAP
jgi:outer membrane protein assembly factor BamB